MTTPAMYSRPKITLEGKHWVCVLLIKLCVHQLQVGIVIVLVGGCGNVWIRLFRVVTSKNESYLVCFIAEKKHRPSFVLHCICNVREVGWRPSVCFWTMLSSREALLPTCRIGP